jgi:hypothetical protein
VVCVSHPLADLSEKNVKDMACADCRGLQLRCPQAWCQAITGQGLTQTWLLLSISSETRGVDMVMYTALSLSPGCTAYTCILAWEAMTAASQWCSMRLSRPDANAGMAIEDSKTSNSPASASRAGLGELSVGQTTGEVQ